jgi:hypothetical protein
MKSLPTLAAAAALFTGFTVFSGFSSPASAGDWASRGTVGPWQMEATDTVCKARSFHKNGTQLHFAINAKGAAMIGITNPDWKIPEGSYDVVMQVDRAVPATFDATGKDHYVIFAVEFDEPTINLLSYGRTLFVTVGQQSYQYDLTMSEAMLKALGKCAAPMMAAANPFSGSPPAATSNTPASTDTPSNPFRRL